MTYNLLACPFCGMKQLDFEQNEHARHYVMCLTCGCEGPWTMSKPAAAADWNRRAQPDTPSAEAEPERGWTHAATSKGDKSMCGERTAWVAREDKQVDCPRCLDALRAQEWK